MRCVRVIVADRHPVFLRGMMSVLGASGDFKVVASCGDGVTCLQAIRDLCPDVALLDVFMPGLTGLDILAATTLDQLSTRIVFLTASVQDGELVTAAAKGAYGVVLKEAAPKVLLHCLRRVAAGQKLLPFANDEDPRRHRLASNTATGYVMTELTERERQIMHLVSEGLSNKDVGRQLKLSEGTIKVHLHHIFQKLAVSNRTALAALAFSDQDNLSSDDVPGFLSPQQFAGIGSPRTVRRRS